MYVFIRVYMNACTVYMYVRVFYVCVYIYTHTHTYIHVYIYVCMHMFVFLALHPIVVVFYSPLAGFSLLVLEVS